MNCSNDDLLIFDDATSARTSLASRSKYAQHCLSQLSLMRQQMNQCDLSIEINQKEIFCHKFLLIAVSDYFKAMFDGLFNDFHSRSFQCHCLGHMSESQSNHVELKGFDKSSESVESIIDFCYSGLLEITFDNVDQLLHVATHLQIISAINFCSAFLIQSCSISNCIDIYKLADFYTLNNVLTHLCAFISKHFLSLMFEAREQFEQLTYEQLSKELSRDTLDMNTYDEYDLFLMTCQWIEVNLDERDQHTVDLFQLIRFMLMTPEQLSDHVRIHPLIIKNEQSRRLVENALCFYALPQRQALSNDRQCCIRNESVLVAVGEIELFVLNTEEEKWQTLCPAPLEENYPVRITYGKNQSDDCLSLVSI